MATSVKEPAKQPDSTPARASSSETDSTASVSPPGPEAGQIDGLQSMADSSAQVASTQNLSGADATTSDAQTTSPTAVPSGPVEDAGATSFSEKKVAAGAALARAPLDGKSMEGFIIADIQHAATLLYNVRDLYEKRDWKTGVVLILDAINAFLSVETKVGAIPGFAAAIPFVGGVVTGLKGMVNTARIMESMATLDQILDKVTLNEDDKEVLKAYRKEQKISQFKNVTMSILGFARFAAEFFGVGTFVSAAQGIVSAVFAIRDFWISSQEAKMQKAQARLGIEDMGEEDRDDIGEVAEILQNEEDIGWIQALVTGGNFSIKNLVEVYNRLQTERQKLRECRPGGESARLAKERVAQLEASLQQGIASYNAEMLALTGPFEDGGFKPITLQQVEKLHDYHVTCMQKILQEAKAHMEKIEWSVSGVFRYIKGEKKEDILKQVYRGRVPEKIDIKLGVLTADQKDYFWEKTEKALSNSLIVAQMSKATLVREMRQILLRNRDVILANSGSGDGLFTSAASFESDMNQVLNTIDL